MGIGSGLKKIGKGISNLDFGGIGKSTLKATGSITPKLATGAAAIGTTALVGGAIGDINKEDNGFAGGAATGAAILGVGALLGGTIGLGSIAKGIGKATFAGGGKAAIKEGFKGSLKATTSGMNMAGKGILATGAVAAATLVGGVATAGELAGKTIKKPDNLNLSTMWDARFNAGGKALIGGSLVLGGAKGIADSYFENRQGTSDGRMRTATPMIPQIGQDQMNGRNQYASNAGASGDIVFAMRNNR